MNRMDEVRNKENRLRLLMDANGLDAVLLKKQANFSWLTAGGTNRINLATEAGVTSLLIDRSRKFILANRTEMRRMLQEEGLENLGFEPMEYEWFEDREMDLVKKVIPNLSKLGTDTEAAGAKLLEADVKKLRYSLTPPEIERFKFLGERASLAMEKVMLGVRPGDSELEIAGRLGPQLWADGIDLPMILVGSDERIFAFRHPIPTPKLFRKHLLVAVNARYAGLVLSLTRMLHCGRPSVALTRQFEANLNVECRMIAATKPGVELRDIFATACAAYEEYGAANEWKLLHQGGGIGYAGREFKLAPEIVGVVEQNQGFCYNPSITGTKTEDSFIATQEGPVMLSGPAAFPKVIVEAGGRSFVRAGLLVND